MLVIKFIQILVLEPGQDRGYGRVPGPIFFYFMAELFRPLCTSGLSLFEFLGPKFFVVFVYIIHNKI